MPRGRRACAIATALAALAAVVSAGCASKGDIGESGRSTSSTSTQRSDPPSSAGDSRGGSPQVKPGSTASSPAPGGAGGGPPPGVPPAHPIPAAFRPAPGAPSDTEVREQLAQLSALKRREREEALSAAAANLAGLLPWSLEPKTGVRESVASVFTDYGLGLACGGTLGRRQLGVAHKTAPCGTLITFEYGGRSLTVPVIDRGPYVAGREWDLTGATAAALGFPGLGRIRWAVAG